MASIVEITIIHNRVSYRVSPKGAWFILDGPRYTWKPIEKKKIPPAVIIKSREVFG